MSILQHTAVLNDDTARLRYPSFNDSHKWYYQGVEKSYNSELTVTFFKCPNCGEYTIRAQGTGNDVKSGIFYLKPFSSAKIFPEYIPLQIRQDYEEACAIEHLSPKASATLSRRCLQGMIHDFWNIHEKNLNAEITSLKSKVTAAQWKAIDALRSMGNIGAHMEHDVDKIIDIEPYEANKLIKLIELLIDKWYINRYEEEQLLQSISDMGNEKELQRKGD